VRDVLATQTMALSRQSPPDQCRRPAGSRCVRQGCDSSHHRLVRGQGRHWLRL
jgi:hypothetical protein